MSTVKIYIVEDEPLYANELEILVDDLGYDLIGISDNSDTAQKEIEEKQPDLVLMDVKINGSMNGIGLAESLTHQAVIIFITSFSDEFTFSRARETKPFAFITKPFDIKNLERTIELAFINTEREEKQAKKDTIFQNCFFVKSRNKLEKVNFNDILYLEVEDRHSTIFTNNGQKYVLRMSMSEIQDQLSPNMFMRIHRKYTVRLERIDTINIQDNVVTVGEVELPISRSHKDDLLSRLKWLQ